MADLCHLLKVKQLRTSVYYPQTDGLVECFNQTLKKMLRRVVTEDGRDWDLMLPYMLFGVREVPQASTGFAPFELLFGRQPMGLLGGLGAAASSLTQRHRACAADEDSYRLGDAPCERAPGRGPARPMLLV